MPLVPRASEDAPQARVSHAKSPAIGVVCISASPSTKPGMPKASAIAIQRSLLKRSPRSPLFQTAVTDEPEVLPAEQQERHACPGAVTLGDLRDVGDERVVEQRAIPAGLRLRRQLLHELCHAQRVELFDPRQELRLVRRARVVAGRCGAP